MSDDVAGPAAMPFGRTTEPEALDWAGRLFEELPVAKLLGAHPLACDPRRGQMKVEFKARREFCNLMGAIQGGMLTAMLDLSMAFAVLCTFDDGYVVPSLELKTSFLAPARPGAIIGEGMLLRKGRTIAFMQGQLTDTHGSLLATASATGQIRQRQSPKAQGELAE